MAPPSSASTPGIPTSSSPRRSRRAASRRSPATQTLRREVRYGEASRIDILLEDARKGRCYVEVKNVHLMRASRARRVSRLRDRARRQAPARARGHGGRRASRRHGVPDPAHGCQALLARAPTSIPGTRRRSALASEAGVEAMAFRCRMSPKRDRARSGPCPIVVLQATEFVKAARVPARPVTLRPGEPPYPAMAEPPADHPDFGETLCSPVAISALPASASSPPRQACGQPELTQTRRRWPPRPPSPSRSPRRPRSGARS